MTDEEVKRASEIESRLLAAWAEGILFVSATAAPLVDSTQYSIVVGSSRVYDERTVTAVVERWLIEWYPGIRMVVICRGGTVQAPKGH